MGFVTPNLTRPVRVGSSRKAAMIWCVVFPVTACSSEVPTVGCLVANIQQGLWRRILNGHLDEAQKLFFACILLPFMSCLIKAAVSLVW